MKVIKLLKSGRPTLSFEVFPPKTTTSFENVKKATQEIGEMHPDFMSVTYGAGGTTDAFTASIAGNIQTSTGTPTMAHLTCVCSDLEKIDAALEKLQANGIENIMALRGDLPRDADPDAPWAFRHASQLAAYIKAKGDFCVGGACYPEGHPESANQKQDIQFLKHKAEMGCDFFTTQMFFDNNIFYNFLFKVRDAGITVPVVAGIMPVTNGSQIKRTCQLSGTMLPPRFRQIVDRFGENPEAMKQAGIAFATEQIIDLLANGVNNVHVYSMNKPDVARAILQNLSQVLQA